MEYSDIEREARIPLDKLNDAVVNNIAIISKAKLIKWFDSLVVTMNEK